MSVHQDTKHSINITQGVLTTAYMNAYFTGCHTISVFLRKHTCKHTSTHIAQAFPQVTVDGVLVAVAFEVADDADLKDIRCHEVPQHVQDARSLNRKDQQKNKHFYFDLTLKGLYRPDAFFH